MSSYAEGQSVLVSGTFRDTSGALANPTTVTLDVRPPGGPTTTYTYGSSSITRPSTGLYQFIIDTSDAAGQWFYRWRGVTGSVTPTGRQFFYVEPKRV